MKLVEFIGLNYFFILLLTLSIVLPGQAQTVADKSKNINLAGIPVVNYSNATGFSFGAFGQAFYKFNWTDTISPSSSTGIFGMYTTNDTYFIALFQRLFLKEDKWRIMFATGFGNINYQYWQEVPGIGGGFIGFGTKATFTMAQVERKVYRQLYAGINTVLSVSETEYDLPDAFPDSLRYDIRKMNKIGYVFNYDKREHQINPFGGYNVMFKNDFYRKWIGSENNFKKFDITYNHYYMIKNNRNMIATRFHAAISTGDVPFQGQNVVGQDDIRGYSKGKYRENQVYALQAEYRWRFNKKLGMVGFFGLASAVENIADIPKNEILPGAGVGFRYMMLEKERINIGIDFAKGKGDWGLYFRIGESFGR